jgi:N-acetylmuramoyl-L-alanine amidase
MTDAFGEDPPRSGRTVALSSRHVPTWMAFAGFRVPRPGGRSPKASTIGTWRRPRRATVGGLVIAMLLAACGPAPTPDASPPPTAATDTPSPTSSMDPETGSVEPAPGSDSAVYPPNPGAVLVAIDAGHGGCLDWGVPDPSERGVELAEKTLTLGIAQRLRDLLVADGIGVLMIRDADVALAGDNEPAFGCDGPAWRDVDGDGRSGFEETGRIRTRDELQARIDLANLARADVLVSIHINSLTQDGVAFEIAATQTFYDDETPWGASSGSLADSLQAEVMAAIEPLATYDRQDRGTDAVAFFAVSRQWQDDDTCETPGDTWCKPHRALSMPSALAEVGSINLLEEHDLLASAAGQDAIAAGLFEGIAGHLGARPLAARIGLDGEAPGERPEALDGTGPPFVAPAAPSPLRLRLTNTGTQPWPAGMSLVAGWEMTDLPYLGQPPDDLVPVGNEIPALSPGESVVVEAGLPAAPAEPAVAWIGLRDGNDLLADAGSPPLQLSSQPD